MIHGISTFLHAPLKDEVLKTYSVAPSKLSGAIEAAPSVNYNTAPIYSDDRLKYKDVSFADGTILLTVDYANKEILSPLYGRTTEDISFTPAGEAITPVTTTKHISNSGDISIAHGFGYIISDFDVDNKKNVYTVRFFYKVEFAPSLTTARTREGNKTYNAAQLTGTIYELPNGDWMEEADFGELAVAVEYLKSLFKQASV